MAEESVRLTRDLRRQIAQRLMADAKAKTKDGDAKTIEGIIKQSALLTVEAYELLYDKATRQKMAKLPEGWLPMQDHVDVTLTVPLASGDGDTDGKTYKLHFDGYSNFLPRVTKSVSKGGDEAPAKKQRFLHKDVKTYYSMVKIPRKSEFVTKLSKLEVEANAIIERDNNLRKEIDSVLASVTTLKQLITIWPEVEMVARAVVAGVTVVHHQVPAVVLTGLNQKLGLTKAA